MCALPSLAQEHPTLQQQAEPEASSIASNSNEVPQVPGMSSTLHGFNGGMTFSGIHDAATGWATIFTPAIGYSFNDHFSADVSIPIYLYRLAESRSTKPKPNAELVDQRGEPGDTVLSLHAQFSPKLFDYELTGAAAFPSGDEEYGLTSGRVTFDFNNHFEHSYPWVAPSIDIGAGDSSTLSNRLLTRDYTSLGPLAHFQVGLAFPLLLGASFETVAFEQLPIGDQKIYTSTTRKKVTTTVVAGFNVTEDNGFINSLDIPIPSPIPYHDHFTLNSYYSRSLRQHDDIISIGLTYVLRSLRPTSPIPDTLNSDIDKLLR